MARPCTVCTHADLIEINRAIVDAPKSFRAIGLRFGLNEKSLIRHATNHLTEGLRAAVAQHVRLAGETRDLDEKRKTLETETRDMDVIATLNRCADRAERMLDAAYRWLEDPARPGELNLNPRSHEVEVIYEEHDGQRLVKKSAKLSELLVKAATGTGLGIVKAEWKIADPRRLLLDAVTTLKPVAELLGKASGKLKPEPAPSAGVNILTPGPVNVLLSPEWLDMKATLFGILQEHPEALEAVRSHYERKAGAGE